MISVIEGRIFEINVSKVVIMIENGLGYECRLSLETYNYLYDATKGAQAFKKMTVYIENVYRDNDIPIMIAFSTILERQLFRNLRKIHGVGLNVAISILSGLGTHNLMVAAQAQSEATYRAIKGIGTQISKQLDFEGKKILLGIDNVLIPRLEKVALNQSSQFTTAVLEFSEDYIDAVLGLVALGWSKRTAEADVTKANKSNPGMNASQIIKHCLTK